MCIRDRDKYGTQVIYQGLKDVNGEVTKPGIYKAEIQIGTIVKEVQITIKSLSEIEPINLEAGNTVEGKTGIGFQYFSLDVYKRQVPKYLYPLSCILFNYIIFLISLLVLGVLGIYCGVKPTWHVVQIIFPLILLPILTYGVGMILATITVFFRDMEYLWEVILMLIMYTCAIFYYPEKIMNSGFSWILKLNPLYCIIQNFRDAILGQQMNIHLLVYAAIVSVIALVIGNIAFYKKQDQFILHV